MGEDRIVLGMPRFKVFENLQLVRDLCTHVTIILSKKVNLN